MRESGAVRHTLITPVWFVASGVLLWSTAGVFIKLTSAGAVTVNFGRALFAAVTVAAYLAAKGTIRFDRFSIFAGFFYAGTLSCFVYANKYTTAANAIFLQYTAPVYILIFAPILLRDHFRIKDLITVAACMAGMSLFFVDSAAAGITDTVSGKIAGLLAGAFLGFYFIMLRHPKSLAKDPALSVLSGNLIIVIAMLPFVLWGSEPFFTSDLWAISYLGVFQLGLAYILFTHGVAKGVRSLDASIIGFMEPLLNPVWVYLVLGEAPSEWAFAGGALIVTSVLVHTFFLSPGRVSAGAG